MLEFSFGAGHAMPPFASTGDANPFAGAPAKTSRLLVLFGTFLL